MCRFDGSSEPEERTEPGSADGPSLSFRPDLERANANRRVAMLAHPSVRRSRADGSAELTRPSNSPFVGSGLGRHPRISDGPAPLREPMPIVPDGSTPGRTGGDANSGHDGIGGSDGTDGIDGGTDGTDGGTDGIAGGSGVADAAGGSGVADAAGGRRRWRDRWTGWRTRRSGWRDAPASAAAMWLPTASVVAAGTDGWGRRPGGTVAGPARPSSRRRW